MNSNPRFHFTAAAAGVMADYAHLTLYDGRLDTVLKGYGKVEGDLTMGLYKLVVVLNEQMIERFIRLDKAVNEIVALATSASSALAEGLGNTHEYYSYPAKDAYFEPTTNLGNPAAAESIFLFFRYPDEKAFLTYNPNKESLGKGFILLDQQRKRLCNLTAEHIKEELIHHGWLALHIQLSPGTYYLYYAGRKADKARRIKMIPAREMPIAVFAGWQTQCFMTFGIGPIFRSWFVSLRNVHVTKEHYRPEDNNLYNIEGLLQKFNNGIFYLPDSVILQLTQGKWENPILGLLAAYAYFHSGKRDHDDLFRQVVVNMAGLLGATSPDYIALAIAARRYFPDLPWPEAEMTAPAMFLTGIRAVLAAGGEHILPESLAERVVGKFFSDMFWTSYVPLSLFREHRNRLPASKIIAPNSPVIDFFKQSTQKKAWTVKGMINASSRSKKVSKIIAEPKRLATTTVRKPAVLRSWLATSLMDLLLHPGAAQLSPGQLAVNLRVTPNLLIQAVTEILNNEKEINDYLKVKEKNADWSAFSPANMERLKQLRWSGLNKVAFE